MANYVVKLSSAPKGHVVPALLQDVGAWVKKQEHGSLGWFDVLGTEAIPKEWDEANAARLQKSGFAFLSLPEGSLLALLTTGAKSPPAVVLLGSEGDRRTVANSLEEFLALWSNGETEISELDDEDAADGRGLLAKWLKAKKVKAPKTKDFDFQAWLDGDAKAPPAKAAAPAKAIARKPTATLKKLGPKAQKLASIVGVRVDDPAVSTYFTKVLAKKVPQSTSERNDHAGISAPKVGIELSVTHDILNEAYPPIQKTAKSFIPYVSYVWIDEKFDETILDAPWNAASEAEVITVLGKPMTWRGIVVTDEKKTIPVWTYSLDDSAQIKLEISFEKRVRVTLSVARSRELSKFHRVTTGLFLGWAATHGLLDESRFAAHAALVS